MFLFFLYSKPLVSNRANYETPAIAFSKFNQYSPEKIAQMIIHCDSQILDSTVVIEFLQCNDFSEVQDQTSKELAAYAKDWTTSGSDAEPRESDPNELTREDQIYLYTSFELHHYWRSRMRAIALTKTYEEEYEEIVAKIRQVSEASESLRSSVALMNVLGLILDIGNYMNDANKQARGFKLSSLARLAMVKDDKNETNLADLIERIVRIQYPEWGSFLDDIQGVIATQKINVDALKADAQKYMNNVKNVQSSLDIGNLSDPKKFHPQDRVSQLVQRSMKDARRKAEQMQVYLEEMDKSYRDIMVFYGEDADDESARRDFFEKLAIFVSEWKKSREKNLQLEETRRRIDANLRRKNQTALKLKAEGLTSSGGATTPQSTGAMDSLLEKLRQAKPQNRDERDRRRRARLKDRHQVRIASGQKIPDPHENPTAEKSLNTDEIQAEDGGATAGGTSSQNALPQQTDEDGNLLSPLSALSGSQGGGGGGGSGGGSGDEDVGNRAQKLLMGMRDGDSLDEVVKAERKKAAEEERRARRRRREKASQASSASAVISPASPREEMASPTSEATGGEG